MYDIPSRLKKKLHKKGTERKDTMAAFSNLLVTRHSHRDSSFPLRPSRVAVELSCREEWAGRPASGSPCPAGSRIPERSAAGRAGGPGSAGSGDLRCFAVCRGRTALRPGSGSASTRPCPAEPDGAPQGTVLQPSRSLFVGFAEHPTECVRNTRLHSCTKAQSSILLPAVSVSSWSDSYIVSEIAQAPSSSGTAAVCCMSFVRLWEGILCLSWLESAYNRFMYTREYSVMLY